ncbi:MAG: hypothetical protein ACE5O2_10150 [Armatimonadota bacterium]
MLTPLLVFGPIFFWSGPFTLIGFMIAAPIHTPGYNQALGILGATVNVVFWVFGIGQLVRPHRIRRDAAEAARPPGVEPRH